MQLKSSLRNERLSKKIEEKIQLYNEIGEFGEDNLSKVLKVFEERGYSFNKTKLNTFDFNIDNEVITISMQKNIPNAFDILKQRAVASAKKHYKSKRKKRRRK